MRIIVDSKVTHTSFLFVLNHLGIIFSGCCQAVRTDQLMKAIAKYNSQSGNLETKAQKNASLAYALINCLIQHT